MKTIFIDPDKNELTELKHFNPISINKGEYIVFENDNSREYVVNAIGYVVDVCEPIRIVYLIRLKDHLKQLKGLK